jgi:hypothetical protein
MKWIDVEEDLPPKNLRVLVHCQMREDGVFHISDAYFLPGQGWFSYGFDQSIYRVHQWYPLSSEPFVPRLREEFIQPSLEAFRAACEKLGDSQ